MNRFAFLLALLHEGNARVNLTALKTERDIVLKHFVDSASCLIGGHLASGEQVLDIGTGAGFPALPLAILDPARQITALDSVGKKIKFVDATASALELDRITALTGRAEHLGRNAEHRATYDRVVVRAVAALPAIVELALPLLKVGGVLVAQKGALTSDELDAGAQAALELGGLIVATETFTLPVLGDARSLIVVKKTGATSARYPRREGVPARQPLFWKAK
nr:16S rRNA (guanine(527)-N(7))-methyltransferase RsmG [Deinococcus sp.]